jgi:hypothetical protein
MVSKRQFMIVYSEHGSRVQRSQETLADQEKQEIQSEYKKCRSVDPADDQVSASTLAVAASRRAADDRMSDSRGSPSGLRALGDPGRAGDQCQRRHSSAGTTQAGIIAFISIVADNAVRRRW